MKILLVEDDSRTAAFITKGLRESGFTVHAVADAEAARLSALHEPCDVVILDRMLPGRQDGLAVVRALRAAGRQTPIIILSAKDKIEDRVEGLQAGADDYLVKPFAFSELLWRVQALLRRAHAQPQATTLKVGGLELDLLARRVTREGRELDLQPGEFALLEYLMRNAGRVVTKTMLIEHVWDYNFDPQTNVVESRVARLRRKVDDPFDTPMIHTMRGAGYILKAHA